MSIIFISHKLNEVLEIADRITVLRRGKKIDTRPAAGRDRGGAGADDGRAGGAAAGREAGRGARRRAARGRRPQVFDDRGSQRFGTSRFDVRAGEIVGIAGVDGNGQSELIEAITGLRRADVGHDRRGGRT